MSRERGTKSRPNTEYTSFQQEPYPYLVPFSLPSLGQLLKFRRPLASHSSINKRLSHTSHLPGQGWKPLRFCRPFSTPTFPSTWEIPIGGHFTQYLQLILCTPNALGSFPVWCFPTLFWSHCSHTVIFSVKSNICARILRLLTSVSHYVGYSPRRTWLCLIFVCCVLVSSFWTRL